MTARTPNNVKRKDGIRGTGRRILFTFIVLRPPSFDVGLTLANF